MISAILDQRTRCFYSAVPKLISLKNNISFQYEYIKRGETNTKQKPSILIHFQCDNLTNGDIKFVHSIFHTITNSILLSKLTASCFESQKNGEYDQNYS